MSRWGMLWSLGFSALVTGLGAADWPCWRGPNHDGTSAEQAWTAAWPKPTPPLAWLARVGLGYSAVSVYQGRAYTAGHTGGQDSIYGLDTQTVKELWKFSYPCASPLKVDQYPGPRATPALDANRLYSMSRLGHVFCLDPLKGSEIWRFDLSPAENSPKWEYSGSPLVLGDLLILNAGASGLALEKATGKVVWKSESKKPGFTSPVPYTRNGESYFVTCLHSEVFGVRASDGKVQWTHLWGNGRSAGIYADPHLRGDLLFVSSNGLGCGQLDCAQAPPKKIWESRDFHIHISQPVFWDGFLYGLTRSGNNDDLGWLKCLDPQTGAVRWSKEGLGGTLMVAGGKIVLLTEQGKLMVLEASPTAYRELASAQILSGPCWTVPTLADGRIFCRNTQGTVVCVDVSGK